MASRPTPAELAGYPNMTRWFNPPLLAKLLLRVIISDVFGQYADRRLLEAALDTKPDRELLERADITNVVKPDGEGAVWIDFVADLGDGFDATYAIAYLLAQETLRVKGAKQPLPRGRALFMGGDEVYPTANRDDYRMKTVAPYAFAAPDREAPDHPLVFMIPGNHDWYDGLVTFLAYFCREKPTRLGDWRTRQQRSYFAVKLTEQCWVWAIDIALVSDMDQPQADYFVAIAKAMPKGAQIILCSAEPGWYKAEQGAGSFRTLSYAAWIAENAHKELRIPLVLSGDTHHYSRYSGGDGVQYITAGGGGAFLHGTHDLPEAIHADWLNSHAPLSLTTEPEVDHKPCGTRACWPDRDTSRALLWGNLRFPLLNWDFAILLGSVYWVLAFTLTQLPRCDVAVIEFMILAAGFVSYTGYQEKWTKRAIGWSFAHSLVQFGTLVLLSWAALAIDAALFGLHDGPWWAWAFALGLFMVPVGGAAAAFIFGVYLLLTSRYAGMSHNDAFSAMRLNSHRHFLRIRIAGDRITVFPVGLERVPKRKEWRDNPAAAGNPTASLFLPPDDVVPTLIERPIVIAAARVAPTTDIKTPGELPSKPAG